MYILRSALAIAGGAVTLVLAGTSLYALPATLTLPRGRRPGLVPLTLAEASDDLRTAYPTGDAQIEAARALIGERMIYCRRNSFDSYSRAFSRGYGYCQQTALALNDLLRRLGYDAKVVHCLHNRFPDGRVTAHAWVRVTVNNALRDLDPLFWDTTRGKPIFTPLSAVTDFTSLWRLLGGWGSPAVNAHRYYTTGRDL
ncbi:MAG: transglutaminase domain-containing protein [Caldilineaceae bacterium]